MNVRQHNRGCGLCLGPEASGVVPVGFLIVGNSVRSVIEIARSNVWHNTESICAPRARY